MAGQALTPLDQADTRPDRTSSLGLLDLAATTTGAPLNYEHFSTAFRTVSAGRSGLERQSAQRDLAETYRCLAIGDLFFDHDFNGPEHEYPFEDYGIFNLQKVYDSIVK